MRCPRHEDRLAVATCTVCGGRFCPECAPQHGGLGAPVCEPCRAALPQDATRPRSGSPRALSRTLLVAVLACSFAFGWFRFEREREPPPPRDPQEAMKETMAILGNVTAALEAHREEHGSWPLTLTELVPARMDSVPADPFAPARSLRYGAAPARAGALTLWSVGPDGLDQGGSTLDHVTDRGDVAVPID